MPLRFSASILLGVRGNPNYENLVGRAVENSIGVVLNLSSFWTVLTESTWLDEDKTGPGQSKVLAGHPSFLFCPIITSTKKQCPSPPINARYWQRRILGGGSLPPPSIRPQLGVERGWAGKSESVFTFET